LWWNALHLRPVIEWLYFIYLGLSPCIEVFFKNVMFLYHNLLTMILIEDMAMVCKFSYTFLGCFTSMKWNLLSKYCERHDAFAWFRPYYLAGLLSNLENNLRIPILSCNWFKLRESKNFFPVATLLKLWWNLKSQSCIESALDLWGMRQKIHSFVTL